MPTYNKLVRDRIPDIIKSSGKNCSIEVLSDKEFMVELKKKISEEIKEYQGAKTDRESLEELADVLELIYTLSRIHGASIEEIEKIRKEKSEKRGGFKERIFLKRVED